MAPGAAARTTRGAVRAAEEAKAPRKTKEERAAEAAAAAAAAAMQVRRVGCTLRRRRGTGAPANLSADT